MPDHKTILITAITFLLPISIQAATCKPIDHLPYQINQPGNYCLTKNLNLSSKTDEHAISINASKVTLDLQGHSLNLLPLNSANRIYGILSFNQHDITIKNGAVTGFFYGIYLADAKNSSAGTSRSSGRYRVNHITFKNNFFRAYRGEGVDQVISNCTITNTGGTTVYSNAFSMGIEVIGPNAIVKDNNITDTRAQGTGESVAISFSNNCGNSKAYGNHIFNHDSFLGKRAYFRGNHGHTFGIWVGGNPKIRTDVLIKDNTIKNVFYAVAFSSPTKGFLAQNKITLTDCDALVSSDEVKNPFYKGRIACRSLGQ